MGRREQRAELEATWTVYEPAQRGKPMTAADREQAVTREEHDEQQRKSLDGHYRDLRDARRGAR